jgi:protein-S-isoprenylcysteine O-methyltransferase Ste14
LGSNHTNRMIATILKNLVSFSLPALVLIVVPRWIEPDLSIKHIPVFVVGAACMTAGLCVMVLTISMFIKIGRGTLAPWSPTRKLVIAGLYAHVRNPMIMGVCVVLIGEAIAFESVNILLWSGLFIVINTIYFIVYEEPNLVRRFGDEYIEYRKNVPRWVPRVTPFKPE